MTVGVDDVWVQNLSHVFSETAARARARAAARRARQHRSKLRLPSLEATADGGCSWPWDGAYITHRGAVQPTGDPSDVCAGGSQGRGVF